MTAGAYVVLDGRFLFMMGPTESGDGLALVRLGGHLEPGESPEDAVRREVQEEASVSLRLLTPPATYWAEDWASDLRGGLRSIRWADGTGGMGATGGATTASLQGVSAACSPADPLLVMPRVKGGGLSVTYLALAEGSPRPGAEAQGIIFLEPTWVQRLSRDQVTLGQFLQAGGEAILRQGFDLGLLLLPFPQLQLLPQLLARHPDLI